MGVLMARDARQYHCANRAVCLNAWLRWSSVTNGFGYETLGYKTHTQPSRLSDCETSRDSPRRRSSDAVETTQSSSAATALIPFRRGIS